MVVVPFDVQEAFGTKRPPVRAKVNGYAFRTTIAPMGGRSFLGLNREVREGAGIAVGDTVSVELERDKEPRVVEDWITEAKRDATRQRRLHRAIDLLQTGTKTPL